jgi:hypothetical protein
VGGEGGEDPLYSLYTVLTILYSLYSLYSGGEDPYDARPYREESEDESSGAVFDGAGDCKC